MNNLVDLKEVVFFQEGPGVRKWQFRNEGIKLLNVKNIVNGELDLSNTERYLDPKEVSSSYNHFLLEPNDIVMASSGVTWGKTAIVKKEHLPLCLNTSTIRFKSLDENILNRDYLLHFLNSRQFRDQIERLITGSAQPNFGPSHLTQVKLYLPPLPQQKRIAAILDKADAVRRKRQETIRLLDVFLRSVFLEMFGEPVRNEKGWEKKKLEQICVKITDGTHSSPPNFSSGDYPYITAKNIKKQGIDLSELTYISKEYHKEIFQRCNPEKGDILYIKDGVTTGIAQVNTLDFEFSMLSSVALLKLNALEITPYYLREVLNNDSLYGYIRGQMGGAAITRLTLNKINNISIPIPPIEIQRKFDLIVQETEKQKELMRKSLIEMENCFNSSMQKAFRGEL